MRCLDSSHGNTTSGVNLGLATPRNGHCQHCHDPHAGPSSGVTGGPYDYNLINTRTNNAVCYTATGLGSGCHSALPTTYPAQEADRLPGTATYPSNRLLV
ncbi:MAG: hypothetical protein KJ739_01720 [Nitrospinae bacterium]|nr:hypothetical protein [Nitrospinota bacterium]